MELKEGMYVRTKITDNYNNVYIVKITDIDEYDEDDENMYWINKTIYDGWNDAYNYLTKEEIKKASFNIIDLIEVGDYVNGCIVTKTANSFSGIYIEINYGWERKSLDNRDIKSIVTHEQFESMKYEVK